MCPSTSTLTIGISAPKEQNYFRLSTSVSSVEYVLIFQLSNMHWFKLWPWSVHTTKLKKDMDFYLFPWVQRFDAVNVTANDCLLLPKSMCCIIDLRWLTLGVWHIPCASVFPPKNGINGTQLSFRTLTMLSGNFRFPPNEIRLHG